MHEILLDISCEGREKIEKPTPPDEIWQSGLRDLWRIQMSREGFYCHNCNTDWTSPAENGTCPQCKTIYIGGLYYRIRNAGILKIVGFCFLGGVVLKLILAAVR